MIILSSKNTHNGGYAIIDTDTQSLVLLHESEKNNKPRYSQLLGEDIFRVSKRINDIPDVVCISGWSYYVGSHDGVGYRGVDRFELKDMTMFGKPIKYFSSTHEMSHIMQAYGMSPFPQGRPVYCLVYEGSITNFYYIDENLNIQTCEININAIGRLYLGFYNIMKNKTPIVDDPSGAGKLMALVSYGKPEMLSTETLIQYQSAVTSLLNEYCFTLNKDDQAEELFSVLEQLNLITKDVDSQAFCNFARVASDTIFHRVMSEIKPHVNQKLPLIISGGCGLNCDWNTMFAKSGVFSEIFVAPCTDDSGSAIGTAIDAMYRITGNAKLKWNTYNGNNLELNEFDKTGLSVIPYSAAEIARRLNNNEIIAFAHGRAEIGPRALGNRSILMSPLIPDGQARLNELKMREHFRPVAPMVLKEDAHEWFDVKRGYESPHMLFFESHKTNKLHAVRHIDGSARIQTVTAEQNPKIHELLTEFKKITGCGVLCNTSLNFNGFGLLNRASDIYAFCKEKNIKTFVLGNFIYTFETNES